MKSAAAVTTSVAVVVCVRLPLTPVIVSGLSDNKNVQVLKGLKAGEEIALEDPTLPNDKKNENDD